MDYKNGKIYKIYTPEFHLFYVGSTCLPLEERLIEHQSSYQSYENQLGKGKKMAHCGSYFILDMEGICIKLIEDYPCNNKRELLLREKYYYDKYKDRIVNKIAPIRTVEEFQNLNRQLTKNEKTKLSTLIRYEKEEERKEISDKKKQRENEIRELFRKQKEKENIAKEKEKKEKDEIKKLWKTKRQEAKEKEKREKEALREQFRQRRSQLMDSE
ncbi:MAG: hypothetical protein JSS98_17985 [Bacteroidetes bacterium]|nr:hypothetical protein [Bacteroidota bacterium]